MMGGLFPTLLKGFIVAIVRDLERWLRKFNPTDNVYISEINGASTLFVENDPVIKQVAGGTIPAFD